MDLGQPVLDRILADTGGTRPHYERYCITAVPHTLEEVFDLRPPRPGLREELGLPEAPVVVSAILDGVGYRRLELLRAEGAVDLRPFTEEGVYLPLTSVFPTTTTAALSSLASGESPAVHGVLGYRLFRPELGAVVDMIKLAPPGGRENAWEKLGLEPEKVLAVPTLYQRLALAGIPTILFLPKHIADSGLSKALYQGISRTVAFLTASDLLMHLREALSRMGRALLAVYWPSTDSLAHLYGPRSEAFALELAHILSVFARLLEGAPRDFLLLLTSDHGFYEADPERDMVNCAAQAALREALLLPPVGDPRAAYLYLRRGKDGLVERFFAEFFPEDFELLTPEEGIRRKLWGLEPPKPEVRALLGDLVVISKRRKFVLWPTEEFKLRGLHGGLTAEELFVPLLVRYVRKGGAHA
ncbi:MAG: alkaline phosphatase family protein [Candidatus Bipolaricaulota bacterium]|nr:alkaline phosphatase family protein [Candidatus Bipolaricaulota bacterium]MDW8152039.1 alkaline phosphatase family protein [Candidatus Bipolaricaulota bacterium]